MLVEYELLLSKRPSVTTVWQTARKLEDAGFDVNQREIKEIKKGTIKVIDGVVYKLCPIMCEYYVIDEFNKNNLGLLGRSRKSRTGEQFERRVKTYGEPKMISDAGFKYRNCFPTIKVTKINEIKALKK